MQFQKKYLGVLILGVSLVALVGCAAPSAMPTGYNYHHDTYKSATPPPSRKVTAEQRRYMDAAQAEQFRSAVYQLLESLTQRAGMPPKPVYILAPNPMTTFYANIDNDLREGMRHIGYALSDMPTGAYIFTYDAQLLEVPRGYISTGQPNVQLVLKVFDKIGEDARQLSEESGNFYIQGAEGLHIQPSLYDTLPSRHQIMAQEDGFNAIQPRTVGQDNIPSYTPMSYTAPEVSFSEPTASVETYIPRSPSIETQYQEPVMVETFDGPQQGIEIPAHGSVSRWTDY